MKQLTIPHMPSFLDLRVHSFISSSVGSRPSVPVNFYTADLQGGNNIGSHVDHHIDCDILLSMLMITASAASCCKHAIVEDPKK